MLSGHEVDVWDGAASYSKHSKEKLSAEHEEEIESYGGGHSNGNGKGLGKGPYEYEEQHYGDPYSNNTVHHFDNNSLIENKRHQPDKIYVGHLPFNITKRDLEELFGRYGPLLNIEIKHGGFAFILFENRDDAQQAVDSLSQFMFEGQRLTVEFSFKKASGSGNGCLICGLQGHWARECPESKEKGLDVKSGKCFKCGNSGHLAKFCRGQGPTERTRVGVRYRHQNDYYRQEPYDYPHVDTRYEYPLDPYHRDRGPYQTNPNPLGYNDYDQYRQPAPYRDYVRDSTSIRRDRERDRERERDRQYQDYYPQHGNGRLPYERDRD